ncbi:MAG: hypothetical protein A3G87_06050 [Omnitrophica bacterium RIFCSPLOWO2_12_FULL_50_11]|nr:MAG: hypothetical protein A3G87_06050 [Omnitrophica bacterium RIFCSPLOWO2_12_FULL_50_11]
MKQTYREFEVIVVDDGSSDDTSRIVHSYGGCVRYLYRENGGQGAARSTGIRAARGEYIAFLDSDDLWTPTKLERQMSYLARNPAAPFVYCDAEYFDDESGRLLYRSSQLLRLYEGHDVGGRLLVNNFVPAASPVVKRAVFEKVGYFDEDRLLQGSEDWEMWLRIAARYPLAVVREPLARYRLHRGNMVGSGGRAPIGWCKRRVAVIERAVAFAPDVYRPFYHRAMSATYLETAKFLLEGGSNSQARVMLHKAMLHKPCSWKIYLFWVLTFAGSATARVLKKIYYSLRGVSELPVG